MHELKGNMTLMRVSKSSASLSSGSEPALLLLVVQDCDNRSTRKFRPLHAQRKARTPSSCCTANAGFTDVWHTHYIL